MFLRFLVFFVGIGLFVFYTILLAGAIVNLPASWVGLLYCLFGFTGGVACFMYSYRPRKKLLIIIIPPAIPMLLALPWML